MFVTIELSGQTQANNFVLNVASPLHGKHFVASLLGAWLGGHWTQLKSNRNLVLGCFMYPGGHMQDRPTEYE